MLRRLGRVLMIRSNWMALLVTAVSASAAFAQQPAAPSTGADQLTDFAKQILVPDFYDNERDTDLQSRPEVFVQARFSRGRVSGAAPEDAVQNFEMTRIETRWAGRLSDRVGAGLELQFHPADRLRRTACRRLPRRALRETPSLAQLPRAVARGALQP